MQSESTVTSTSDLKYASKLSVVRKYSKTTKPAVSLVVLIDGSLSSPELVRAHKDVNFTTYSTHMILYRYGELLR